MEGFGRFISYAEATKSQTGTRLGIDNTPNEEQLDNMHAVASIVFDRIRDHFKKPIAVTSFFRCYALNKAIGGAPNSQHTSGEAIDIDADVLGGLKNSELFHYIKDNLTFDQLIWEFGNNMEPDWVHVSYKTGVNRNTILIGYKDNGRTLYKPYRQ